MKRFLRKVTRIHKAVYWKPLKRDGYGDFQYDAPMEIDCRWDDRRVNFVDREGAILISSSVIYLDFDLLELGGYILRGVLVDLVEPNNPVANPIALEIKSIKRLSSVDGRDTLYEVMV